MIVIYLNKHQNHLLNLFNNSNLSYLNNNNNKNSSHFNKLIFYVNKKKNKLFKKA